MMGVLRCFTGILAIGASCLSYGQNEYGALVAPFLQEHCFKCHDEKKQKGDVRLDTLDWDFSNGENAVSWQDISDMLIIGEMPPEDEEQPPANAVSEIVELIDSQLRAAAAAKRGGSRIAIRRLSQSALDNTVKDLLGVNRRLSDNLPADVELDGFENLALTLDTNPELVLKLQTNAHSIARDAIGANKDVRAKRVFPVRKIGHGHNVEERDGFAVTSSGRDRKHAMWPEGFVVPQDGLYRIGVTSFAGDNRWDLDARGIQYDYIRKEYRENPPGNKRRSNDVSRLGAIVAIEASEARHEDSGTLPGRRVGFFYSDSELGYDEFEVRLKKGENIMVQYASAANLNGAPYARVGKEKMLVADLLHVKDISVEGPLLDVWPSDAHRQLLGKGKRSVEERIGDFVFRAFRRPVPENTRLRFLELFETGVANGLSNEESMSNVVEAVLCSPRFLYNYDLGNQVDGWALANRLSYFLWNSMPDDELRQLASSGRLLEPDVVKNQAKRMLADGKRTRFVEDFTDQWLGLKKIHMMSPDPKLYKEYDPLLESMMKHESEIFFDEILRENLPLNTFLDSDFVFINERLAKHYQIEGVEGSEFRRVYLDENSPRGGVLGQASILKLTSNGTRTSPVVRGVWVLESLLGTPPSPPPADVEPIEPDVRGTKTIHDMLAKHREVETCNSCHQKIDPWGFGLEQFDAVGVFREKYRNSQDIYSKGTVSNGSFDGIEQMKQVLLDRSAQFTRALTEKLFTYALGHSLTFDEKLIADDLANEAFENDKGFEDLILEICTSSLFLGELNYSDPDVVDNSLVAN